MKQYTNGYEILEIFDDLSRIQPTNDAMSEFLCGNYEKSTRFLKLKNDILDKIPFDKMVFHNVSEIFIYDIEKPKNGIK